MRVVCEGKARGRRKCRRPKQGFSEDMIRVCVWQCLWRDSPIMTSLCSVDSEIQTENNR
jgi:hypothetical protein